MVVYDPDPQLRWLAFLAHPDDEMCMLGWLAQLVRNGAHIEIAWAHSNPIREEESRAVADLIGLRQDRLHFFGAEDGRVIHQSGYVLPLLRDLVAQVQPDRMLTIAFEQGHIDHDAVSYLSNRAFGGPIIECPMYHPYSRRIQTLNEFSDPSTGTELPLDPWQQELKCQAIRMFPSQTIRRNVVSYGLYRRLQGRPVYFEKREWGRIQNVESFEVPNAPERLRAEIEKAELWADWLSAIKHRDA